MQRAQREPPGLDPCQRLLVLACSSSAGGRHRANYLYWTAPGADEVGGVQPRFLVPLVGIAADRRGPRAMALGELVDGADPDGARARSAVRSRSGHDRLSHVLIPVG